jgi:hypothetical protein
MNRIALLLRVSAQAVLIWIRDYAKDFYEKPEPTGRTIVLQLDEMGHYLKKQRCKLWIWKALDHDTGQLLDWECGRRHKATLKKMVDRPSTMGRHNVLYGHMGHLCVSHPTGQVDAEQSNDTCYRTASLSATPRVWALQAQVYHCLEV